MVAFELLSARELSPGALGGFGRRRGLRGRAWFCGRLELPQRRPQRVKAWGVGISIALDDVADCRRYRGELVGREVNYRHGPNVIGRDLSSKEMVDMPRSPPSLRNQK
jgi:hypothetical protein